MFKVIEPIPWSFTIEFDEEKAKRNGYDIETLYDYVGRNVEKYGVTRIGHGTWKAKVGDEVESQCLALSMLSNAKWVMRNVKSLVAFEDDTDAIDCLDVFRGFGVESRDGLTKDSGELNITSTTKPPANDGGFFH